MEVLSVGASCVQLLDVVVRVSGKIGGFVLKVRDARRDMDAVARELSSIKLCAESIKEDCSYDHTGEAERIEGMRIKSQGETMTEGPNLPLDVSQNLIKVLQNATSVIGQIEERMEHMPVESLQGRVKWALNGSNNVMRLRDNLEAHKCALEIAIQLVALKLIRSIQNNTASTRATAEDIRADTRFILTEITALRRQVNRLSRQGGGQHAALLQNFAAHSAEMSSSMASVHDNVVSSYAKTQPFYPERPYTENLPPPLEEIVAAVKADLAAVISAQEPEYRANKDPSPEYEQVMVETEIPLSIKVPLFGNISFGTYTVNSQERRRKR